MRKNCVIITRREYFAGGELTKNETALFADEMMDTYMVDPHYVFKLVVGNRSVWFWVYESHPTDGSRYVVADGASPQYGKVARRVERYDLLPEHNSDQYVRLGAGIKKIGESAQKAADQINKAWEKL